METAGLVAQRRGADREFRAQEIAEKFALLAPTMDERQTRLWLAAEAKAIGRGGIAAVTRATGVLGKRIGIGIRELELMAIKPPQEPPGSQRVRRPGAGRKKESVRAALTRRVA